MKLTILQPTRCNGKRYGAGDAIEVSAAVADGLLAAGSAERLGADTEADGQAAEADAAEKAEASQKKKS